MAMKGKDDRELFARALADAKPLKGKKRVKITALPLPPPSAIGLPARLAPKPTPAPARPTVPAKPAAGPAPLSEGNAAGLDRASAERLRRGQAAIEATLDLHGMILADAEPALARFLERSQSLGKKLVLVVTGKGVRIDRDSGRRIEGAIRRELPHWLNLPKNRGRILAFRQAHISHGGGGAFYVVLRKRK